MTAVVTEATAAARQDYTVHGSADGTEATVKVSATGPFAAVGISGIDRQGARAHVSWFDCLTCLRVLAQTAKAVSR